MESGETLRGIAEGLQPGELARHFGESVVIVGTAVYRPSGSVLRLEADGLEPALGDISVWSRAPRPLLADLDRHSLMRPQGPRSGVGNVMGRWPGDESEEEIFAALEEIS